MVIAINRRKALQPVVRLLWDPAHQRYATPVTVDLAIPDPGAPLRTICEALDPAVEGYDIATCFAEGHGT
jgi:hypothetical protein